jgi:hypothetical protein
MPHCQEVGDTAGAGKGKKRHTNTEASSVEGRLVFRKEGICSDDTANWVPVSNVEALGTELRIAYCYQNRPAMRFQHCAAGGHLGSSRTNKRRRALRYSIPL